MPFLAPADASAKSRAAHYTRCQAVVSPPCGPWLLALGIAQAQWAALLFLTIGLTLTLVGAGHMRGSGVDPFDAPNVARGGFGFQVRLSIRTVVPRFAGIYCCLGSWSGSFAKPTNRRAYRTEPASRLRR